MPVDEWPLGPVLSLVSLHGRVLLSMFAKFQHYPLSHSCSCSLNYSHSLLLDFTSLSCSTRARTVNALLKRRYWDKGWLIYTIWNVIIIWEYIYWHFGYRLVVICHTLSFPGVKGCIIVKLCLFFNLLIISTVHLYFPIQFVSPSKGNESTLNLIVLIFFLEY